MNSFEQAACTGKKTYNFQHARRVASNVSRRHDEPMQPYHCVYCHGWHVGQPGRKPPNLKSRKGRNQE